MAPRAIRRIRDGIVGHPGRKGTFKPFLTGRAEEVREMWLACGKKCPALQCMIHEKLGVEVPLRTLQRYCKVLKSKEESGSQPGDAP